MSARKRRFAVAPKVCQRVPGKVVDRAISDLLLELVQPLTLEVALAVQQEVEARFAETDASTSPAGGTRTL